MIARWFDSALRSACSPTRGSCAVRSRISSGMSPFATRNHACTPSSAYISARLLVATIWNTIDATATSAKPLIVIASRCVRTSLRTRYAGVGGTADTVSPARKLRTSSASACGVA